MRAKTACVVVVTVVFLTAGMAWGQPEVEWERTYGAGYDACYSHIQTMDGGFAIAGYTESLGAGSFDFWLLRTDRDGNSLWSRTYGGSGNDQCYSIIQTVDGGFALAGVTSSFGSGDLDFWLVRTDENGDSLWSRTFGRADRQECFSLIQTVDGGFAMAGYTGSFEMQIYEFWLVRTNGDGDSLWSRTYLGASRDYCHSLIQTADGGFALAGSTGIFFGGGDDFWLVRTGRDGDSLWSRTFGGKYEDVCNSLIQTTDGGYVLAGITRSFGSGNNDYWLVRTDEDGDSLWSSTFGGDDNDDCMSLIQTADRGFAMAGYTWLNGGNDIDLLLIRTDSEGNNLWSQTFGGGGWDYGYSLIQKADSRFVIGGSSESFDAGGQYVYLVKTTPDPVSVHESSPSMPETLLLEPAYLNPFNSTTRIGYSTSDDANPTRLAVFDPLGRRVAELIPSSSGTPNLRGGRQSVVWNAAGVPAGEYIVRLEAGGMSQATKVQVVK